MNDPAEDIVGLYRRHARAWSRARGTSLMEARWLATFLSYAPAGGVILDLGCGPGVPIARHVIDQGFAVYGVDSSPEMISLFRRNVAGAQAKVADMRRLDLGRRFDGILAWDSFFHLRPDEQRGMFAIFAALAKSGAPLMFTSGPSAGIAIGELKGEPLYHSSLDPSEYHVLIAEHGFDFVEHQVEDPDCGGHTVWIARRTA